jgi:Tol biopolymer transport system component
MPPKNPVTRRTSLAIMTGLVACAGLPRAATANDGNNQHRISIAVPDFSNGSGADDISPRDITEIIISDLRASGRLALIESNGLVEENINTVPQFDKWRGINAQCLVTGRIVRKPDQRIFVEFRLWDLLSGHQLYGAQYLLQSDNWRRVPHAIAEAILERLVGRT